MENTEIYAKLHYLLRQYSTRTGKTTNVCEPCAIHFTNTSGATTSREKKKVKAPMPLNEEAFQVTEVFNFLCEKYKDTLYVRIYEGTIYLHAYVVIEYWLRCWLVSSDLFNKLISPIKQKTWIDLYSFCESIKEVSKNKIKSIFGPKLSKEKRDNLRREKWIFFYCFLTKETNRMHQDTLKYVFALSAKTGSKERTVCLSNMIMAKLRPRIGPDRDYITYEEFKLSISL